MNAADFLPVVCDVTKEGEVRNLPQIITKHWPSAGIDVLVNNAGGCAGYLRREHSYRLGDLVAGLLAGVLASWLGGTSTSWPPNGSLSSQSGWQVGKQQQWWQSLCKTHIRSGPANPPGGPRRAH